MVDAHSGCTRYMYIPIAPIIMPLIILPFLFAFLLIIYSLC
jgi:hypothetical protein